MNENMEYIDLFFSGRLDQQEKEKFESRILSDEAFADDVAIYLASLSMSRDELIEDKKARFKELYFENKVSSEGRLVKMRWLKPVASAAAILLLVFLGWTFFLKSPDPQQLAENYITKEFKQVGVEMGATQNQLQEGKRLYNEGKFAESIRQFEEILKTDPGHPEALKMAGIALLRMEKYDQALAEFQKLAAVPLYANPGAFYQALTLMKRNQPGDKQKAKALLQEVVKMDLEGSVVARQWLKKW